MVVSIVVFGLFFKPLKVVLSEPWSCFSENPETGQGAELPRQRLNLHCHMILQWKLTTFVCDLAGISCALTGCLAGKQKLTEGLKRFKVLLLSQSFTYSFQVEQRLLNKNAQSLESLFLPRFLSFQWRLALWVIGRKWPWPLAHLCSGL